MSVDAFYRSYRDKGFIFSDKLLTRYCLSLYTKPFTLLSGISGTGKTKIAQLFDVPAAPAPTVAAPRPVAAGGYVIMNLTQGLLHGDGRGNLKFSDLQAVFEPDEVEEINKKIEELRERGGDDNITRPEKFTVKYNGGEFTMGIYLQRANSPLLRVRLIPKVHDPLNYGGGQAFLKQRYQVGDTLKLEKKGPHLFEIAAVNDQAITTISQQIGQQEAAAVSNKLLISVKSNWTESADLLGYYNKLEEKYHCTPVLKFMLTAAEYPEKPFFLILDEMNLSKVEHYFSDILSCLETRMKDGGEWKQEPIRLHDYQGGVDSTDDHFDTIPASLPIPPNLYITGTVNIDETTYMFSPKVLDRANVIEFNDVNLDTYGQTELPAGRYRLQAFPQFGQPEVPVKAHYDAAPDAYKHTVRDWLEILQPCNLHFGYRVINEMALYINHTRQYVGHSEEIIQDAIDIQLLQKVLPKFNGAFGKLDEPLRKLIAYSTGNPGAYAGISLDNLTEIAGMQTSYPETLKKLIAMYRNLVHNGFTSYLE